jgi:hypothetical protein
MNVNSMWSFVSSIQQQLDEAAGLQQQQQPAATGDDAPARSTDLAAEETQEVQNELLEQAQVVAAVDPPPSANDDEPASGATASTQASSNDISRNHAVSHDVRSGEDTSASSPHRISSPSGRDEVLSHDEERTTALVDSAAAAPVLPKNVASVSQPLLPNNAEEGEGTSDPPLLVQSSGPPVQSPSPPASSVMGPSPPPPIPSEKPAAAPQSTPSKKEIQHPPAEVATQQKFVVGSNGASPPPATTTKQKNLSSVASVSDASLVQKLQEEGQALSTEIGLERRKVKTLQGEKKSLEAQLAAAMEQIEELKLEKQQWHAAKAATTAAEAAARERSSTLESLVARQSNELSAYGTKCAALEQKWTLSVAAAEEAESKWAKVLDDVKQEHHEATQAIVSEKDRVAQSLRRTIQELDYRVSQLERELTATAQRANTAESKLVDNSCTASSSVKELTAQLDQMSVAQQRLQQLFQSKQSEYTALDASTRNLRQRAEAAESALSQNSASAAATQARIHELEEALKREHHKATVLSDMFDQSKKQADLLKVQVAELKHVVNDLQQASAEKSVAAAVARLEPVAGMMHASPSVEGSGGNLNGSSSVHNSSKHGWPPASIAKQGNALPTTSRAIEKELAQCTRELHRLRQVESEAASLKEQLALLTTQHDVVLQMFGQAQEELQDCRSDLAESKGIFRSQIEELAKQLEMLQKQQRDHRE